MSQIDRQKLSTITWIADNDLSESLHAATWLETTKTLRQLGWKVNLISHSDAEGERDIRGVVVRFFTKPDVFFIQQLLYHLKVFRWVLRTEDQQQILLFHGISGLWVRLFKWYAAIFTQKKFGFVLDTRTLPMEPEETLTLRAKLRRTYLNFVDRNGHRWFDGRMVITPAMGEVLAIPVDKIWAVWPSGVKPEVFSSCSEERMYPQADEPIRLIYIGCMHVERNLMAMSKAIVQANTPQRDFQLVLVGDGNQFKELAAYAEKHPADILIHGPVAQQEIPGWLTGSHVGILPFPDEQKFRVSSPIKLFEYMAAGMPVLAAKIRCHTDVIEDDAQFIFWAYGSDEQALLASLDEIRDQKNRLAQMGAHSLDNIQHWSWEASAGKIDAGLRDHLHTLFGGEYA